MIKKLLHFITALACLATVAKADSDDNDDEEALKTLGHNVKDFFSDKEILESPLPKIKIVSLEPEQGPTTGETRVLVRGGPFGKWEETYLKPVVSILVVKTHLVQIWVKNCSRLVC